MLKWAAVVTTWQTENVCDSLLPFINRVGIAGPGSDTSSKVTHAKYQIFENWFLACVTSLDVSEFAPHLLTDVSLFKKMKENDLQNKSIFFWLFAPFL